MKINGFHCFRLTERFFFIYLAIYLSILLLFLSCCHVFSFLFLLHLLLLLLLFLYSFSLFCLCLSLSFSLVYALLYHLTSLSDYYTVRKGISSSLKTRSVSVRVTRPVDSYGTRKYARPFLVCILVSSFSLSFRFSSHVLFLSSISLSISAHFRLSLCSGRLADWIYASRITPFADFGMHRAPE